MNRSTISVLGSLLNAAPDWQAGRLRRHSRELVVACPLEGLVMQLCAGQLMLTARVISLIHKISVLVFSGPSYGYLLRGTQLRID
jgi:hypothetical protein